MKNIKYFFNNIHKDSIPAGWHVECKLSCLVRRSLATSRRKLNKNFKKAIDNTKLMIYNTYIKIKQYKINMRASGGQLFVRNG